MSAKLSGYEFRSGCDHVRMWNVIPVVTTEKIAINTKGNQKEFEYFTTKKKNPFAIKDIMSSAK